MSGAKPHVVFISDEPEMVDLVALNLSDRFDVTPVTGVIDLDDALDALRRLKPHFVIVDPDLPGLDHQHLHSRMQADADLKGIQILIVSDDA
jgi:DNA-binding response OmpR family regulator